MAASDQTKRRTGVIVGVFVGTFTAGIVGSVYFLVLNGSNGDPISWSRYALNMMIFGLLVGSIPGILTGVHRQPR